MTPENMDRRVRKTRTTLRACLGKLLRTKKIQDISVRELADMADIYSYICNIVRMCRCMCIYTSRKLLVLCPLCPPFLVL